MQDPEETPSFVRSTVSLTKKDMAILDKLVKIGILRKWPGVNRSTMIRALARVMDENYGNILDPGNPSTETGKGIDKAMNKHFEDIQFEQKPRGPKIPLEKPKGTKRDRVRLRPCNQWMLRKDFKQAVIQNTTWVIENAHLTLTTSQRRHCLEQHPGLCQMYFSEITETEFNHMVTSNPRVSLMDQSILAKVNETQLQYICREEPETAISYAANRLKQPGFFNELALEAPRNALLSNRSGELTPEVLKECLLACPDIAIKRYFHTLTPKEQEELAKKSPIGVVTHHHKTMPPKMLATTIEQVFINKERTSPLFKQFLKKRNIPLALAVMAAKKEGHKIREEVTNLAEELLAKNI